MRLIDADKLIEIIECSDEFHNHFKREFIFMVEEIPTAYDVDKVIEQLEEQKTPNKSMSKTESILRRRNFEDAIEIVKEGGVIDET